MRERPDMGRWEAGYAFAPEGCGQSGRVNPCSPGTLTPAPNPAIVEVEPFAIWSSDACSPFDRTRDYVGRATRQLAATESYQVANELWTGTLAQTATTPNGNPWPNRWLASERSDVLSDGPMDLVQAVGCLTYALGECAHGARGMVHMTRQAAVVYNHLGVIRREGNLLLLIDDTIVVADAGYDGSGPLGQPESAGSQWAYATGMVDVNLGPVQVVPDAESAALDRSNNDLTYRAERLAAYDWDGCCHAAVEINLPLCGIGGPGS